MPGFQAIILICLVTTPTEACNEKSAVGVQSRLVDNEMKCAMGWEDVIARSAQATDVGVQTYVRTLCRRSGSEE